MLELERGSQYTKNCTALHCAAQHNAMQRCAMPCNALPGLRGGMTIPTTLGRPATAAPAAAVPTNLVGCASVCEGV